MRMRRLFLAALFLFVFESNVFCETISRISHLGKRTVSSGDAGFLSGSFFPQNHGEELSPFQLNGRRGQNTDWWVAGVVDGDVVCYFDLNAGSMVQGLAPTYQGPMVSLNDVELIHFQYLPAGMYTFYFGIDLNMNGALDACSLQYGAANVSVEASNPCQ